MKICKRCGDLVSDTAFSCPKCGTAVEINPNINNQQNFMHQNYQQQPMYQQMPQNQMPQQPMHQQMNSNQPMNNQGMMNNQNMMNNQGMMQPQMQPQQPMKSPITIQAPDKSQKKNNNFSENFKKNYKPISIAIIVLLIAISCYLTIDNISLRKKVKLNSTSAVESQYSIKDNSDNTNKVIINAEEDDYNFEIPDGTYPKVSQKYVFFIPEEYVATVTEQSGGISLLNINTGGSGWIAVNRATLAGYRKQKDSLKRTYESQGYVVSKMYDKLYNDKDCFIIELMKEDQPMMLVVTEASSTECYILTITNTNIKNTQDTTTFNDMMKTLSISQKLA